jgi:hypothetical protein
VSRPHKSLRLSAILGSLLALSLGLSQLALAITAPVNLGSANSFAVLAGTGITNTGATTIRGDVGSAPNPSETGFSTVSLTGTNHTAADAVTIGAKNALIAAYIDAAGRTPSTNVVGGVLAGQTLVAGAYNSAGNILDLTGTVTGQPVVT